MSPLPHLDDLRRAYDRDVSRRAYEDVEPWREPRVHPQTLLLEAV